MYLLNRGSLVNLAAGLEAILRGQTTELPNGVQRYPRVLEERVARALATGSV